jgi:hypothetical protein
VPLCPLAIVTEGFAPLRIGISELPLAAVIVHTMSMFDTDMASRDKGSLTIIWNHGQ